MKVLLTTACAPEATPGIPRGEFGGTEYGGWFYVLDRYWSIGLRFLKQNVPEVEILEHPSWAAYGARLREGWDAVGFSFVTCQIPLVLRMVEAARKAGVRAIWGGGYGVLTPGLEGVFDRVFRGPGEAELAGAVGRSLERLRHPPLLAWTGVPGGLRFRAYGLVFTSVGCSCGCSFCQTPVFCDGVRPVPLESLAEVLAHYRGLGLTDVMVLDEAFGLLREHSDAAAELLARHGMRWRCMARSATLRRRAREWHGLGLAGMHAGVESLRPGTLAAVGKSGSADGLDEIVALGRELGVTVSLYAMLGFPEDTAESLAEDLAALDRLDADFYRARIVTPFPRTPLWDEVEARWGFATGDWERFDTNHLVWRHPHLGPERLRGLVETAMRRLNTRRRAARAAARILAAERPGRALGRLGGVAAQLWRANTLPFRQQFLP